MQKRCPSGTIETFGSWSLGCGFTSVRRSRSSHPGRAAFFGHQPSTSYWATFIGSLPPSPRSVALLVARHPGYGGQAGTIVAEHISSPLWAKFPRPFLSACSAIPNQPDFATFSEDRESEISLGSAVADRRRPERMPSRVLCCQSFLSPASSSSKKTRSFSPPVKSRFFSGCGATSFEIYPGPLCSQQ
jgi:hypothetical protein